MRKIYLRNLFPLLIAGILMGSLSACSQSEELSQGESIVNDQKIAIQPEVLMDGIATRAGMELKDLTYFYLRIVNPQSTEYSYFVKMEKDASGNWYASTDMKNGAANPKLFFQNGKQPVTIQAIYWKNTSVDNFMARADEGGWKTPYTFYMSTKVLSSLAIKSSDPLYYNKTIIPQTDAPGGVLPITFQHRFAKVHLRLEFDDYCSEIMSGGSNQSAISNVKFGGLLTGNVSYLKWNFDTNSMDYNGDTRDKVTELRFTVWNIATMTVRNVSAEYEFMAVPQSIPNGSLSASFYIFDEEFKWTYEGQGLNFESNTEYDITLQVNGEDPTTKGISNDTLLTKKNIKITGFIKERKGGQQ